MSMSYAEGKMQPWQVFHAARKILGANIVARIFNREVRSAHNWAQDPAHTECRCKSPLELLHTLFERLDAAGSGYVARAGIDYLATAIDPAAQVEGIRDPLPTIHEEILADYSAVARLQQAIEAGADLETINNLKKEAIEEVERTVARYARDRKNG
ncbi:hypothetical protein Despr_0223 [Desulfobulbus propionicus DSM 2032]|uniref:Uncharacterized protein n=1 Tax=Desulfobulbus propionicus (strain ATCC 33891 / DSM 2032 / VKM B-1956 / 1pr3) TaxID=577650 RepID=A0A7U4DMT4_DESPD|nr:hypothetical protein [Desulfobulbus propionicus]ADW16411.1 hypothetical protein Despr_0223 [Desulfobulbus propionicus DSM 2032]